MSATAMLVLDIDGTVRKGFDELGRFVNQASDVEVFPEAVKLMHDWRERGGVILGASNQGGISLGLVSMADVVAAMTETQRQCDGLFNKISFCLHHPDAKDPEYARCWCRKPRAGLVIEAGCRMNEETGLYFPPHLGLFVGDRDEDRLCAEALNMEFMWAKEWRAMA